MKVDSLMHKRISEQQNDWKTAGANTRCSSYTGVRKEKFDCSSQLVNCQWCNTFLWTLTKRRTFCSFNFIPDLCSKHGASQWLYQSHDQRHGCEARCGGCGLRGAPQNVWQESYRASSTGKQSLVMHLNNERVAIDHSRKYHNTP